MRQRKAFNEYAELPQRALPTLLILHREMETDSMQIVYRRESEGYGVLVPVKRD